MGLIAIGDVHGCARSLEALLEALAPTPYDHLVFVGDYTDRGPRSRETLDILLAMEAAAADRTGPRCTFLRGNHDQMMLDFAERGEAELWHHNGGLTTLASYSTGDGEFYIPEAHVDFLRRTRLYYETEDYCFVHAGLDPHLSVAENLRYRTAETFLWTRDHLVAEQRNWEKPVVCGHTPQPRPLLEPDLLAIDTGCVFPHHPGLGWLSAVHLPSRDWVRVPYQD
jgi:serine/threonine protein phosphatase 1